MDLLNLPSLITNYMCLVLATDIHVLQRYVPSLISIITYCCFATYNMMEINDKVTGKRVYINYVEVVICIEAEASTKKDKCLWNSDCRLPPVMFGL